MIRWMCDVYIKDRKASEELRKLIGVEPITTVIRSGRLKWYGHVMRKNDEDWVKKCRRPIGIHRKDMVRECGSGYGRTRDRQRSHT